MVITAGSALVYQSADLIPPLGTKCRADALVGGRPRLGVLRLLPGGEAQLRQPRQIDERVRCDARAQAQRVQHALGLLHHGAIR